MAKLLPTTHRMDLQVGLAHAGVLFARGRLDGYRQVKFFTDHLRKLGWHEHLLGGTEDMFGCDMLFSQPSQQVSATDDDPSFIRRDAIELWPSQGESMR